MRIYEYLDGYQIRMYNQLVEVSEVIPRVKEIAREYMDDYEERYVPEEPSQEESSDVRTQELASHSLASSKGRTVQQMYEITRSNRWEYFLTLTFNRSIIDSSDYDLITQKVSKWLNNLRNRYASDLKYILVPELHKDGIHYHFHGLLSNIGDIKLVYSGIQKKGMKIYNLSNWKYGFSTVSKVQNNSKVASYITKYITKDLCTVTKNKKRYWCSKNCDKANVFSYNVSYEDIQKIIESNSHLLTHVSDVKVAECGLEVTYIEMIKGD